MDSIIILTFSAFCFICAYFSRNSRRIGKYKFYDGVITNIDYTAKEITIRYTVGEHTYTHIFDGKDFPKRRVSEGMSVMVMTMNNIPVSATYNKKGKNYDSVSTRKRLIAFGILALLAGIISMFN